MASRMRKLGPFYSISNRILWAMTKNKRNRTRRRQRAVSNIMGIALGLAMTIGLAGAVTYFVTQEASILTTQESFLIGGAKITSVGDTHILSFTIKNTGTSVLEAPIIEIHDACQSGSNNATKSNSSVSITATINPGASYSIKHEITSASCGSSATPDINIGQSYIVDTQMTTVGIGSTINETITITARS